MKNTVTKERRKLRKKARRKQIAMRFLTGLLVMPWYHSLILAVLMHVAGVYGDLFESLWKRVYDVKDSGNIIPGHGGFMDRFDSAIFAIPTGALYLMLTGLI